MKPKFDEYCKQKGIQKISEECSHDLKDIRLNIIRESDYGSETNLSRIMKKFKQFVISLGADLRADDRILEIKRKLRGE